jgi:putative salt-induced outer membrane protein YdiY
MRQLRWLGLVLGLICASASLRAQMPMLNAAGPVEGVPSAPVHTAGLSRLPPVENEELTLPPAIPAETAQDGAEVVPASPTEQIVDEALQEMEAVDEQLAMEAETLPKPPKIWSGNFDLGLNGSEGNSNQFNFRFNVLGERKTADTQLTLRLNYVKTEAQSTETANRLFFDGRNEWLCVGSPWSYYLHETTEYDEFRTYDFRVAMDAGVSYQFLDSDKSSLKGRFGPSTSREVGGTDDEWVPELAFGTQFEHALNDRHQIVTSIDYFPDVTDFNSFRVNSQASWQVTVDQANNLSVKFSVVDRYDSTPNGVFPNDLDYAVTLVYSF